MTILRIEQLEVAAAQAKLGFWEYDQRSSRLRLSAVAHQILDLPQDSVLDLDTVSRLQAPEFSGSLELAIELALREGKPFSLVSELDTPSGKRKWIRAQGQVGDGQAPESDRVFGTIQDISELRLLDRVTKEREVTLSQVEAISHIGHWSVSLVDGSIYHSDEIKRIFGYQASQYALTVDEAINAYHPDDRDEVVRLFNRAVETGEGYEFDLRVVQPGGDVRYVHSKGYTEQDERGKVVRVYGVFQDLTERELSARALRESDASMKALVDGVRTAIVVHGKHGEILLSNQMANRLLAPLAQDVVGKDLSDPAWRFISEDGRDVPIEGLPVSRILRTRKPVENLVIGRHDDQAIAWMLVNGVPVFDHDGELSKIVISFVDITERKAMEQRLHQSEKMKAIGHLAGGIAHDFNNQLMVMLSCAELLEGSFAVGSPESSYLREITSGVSHSADLTRQLLAFARKGKYVVTIVDMNELIFEVVSIAGRSFDKRIKISLRADANPATITGDRSQLQNALLNVALNSRDAMHSGGELTFATDRVILDEAMVITTGLDVEPGEHLRVTIRDNGSGMDAATQARIFEPFFTTKQPGQGTGMGMASVYGTVKSHHGAIDVTSQPGEGTTITMHFPLTAGDRDRPEKPAIRPQRSEGRILVVDDERAVALSTSLLLQREGYETSTCANGRDALREFRMSHGSIDLVLLDMIMPDMNGIEVFYAMKKIDPKVQVVLISGFSFTDEAKSIAKEGAAGFLLKPVTAAVLFQTVASVLTAHRTQGVTG